MKMIAALALVLTSCAPSLAVAADDAAKTQPIGYSASTAEQPKAPKAKKYKRMRPAPKVEACEGRSPGQVVWTNPGDAFRETRVYC